MSNAIRKYHILRPVGGGEATQHEHIRRVIEAERKLERQKRHDPDLDKTEVKCQKDLGEVIETPANVMEPSNARAMATVVRVLDEKDLDWIQYPFVRMKFT